MADPLPMACRNCRYFGPLARLAENGIKADWGSCRKHAPRGPVVDHSTATGIDFFPTVREHDWCAEYWGTDGGGFTHPNEEPF